MFRAMEHARHAMRVCLSREIRGCLKPAYSTSYTGISAAPAVMSYEGVAPRHASLNEEFYWHATLIAGCIRFSSQRCPASPRRTRTASQAMKYGRRYAIEELHQAGAAAMVMLVRRTGRTAGRILARYGSGMEAIRVTVGQQGWQKVSTTLPPATDVEWR